MLFIIGLIIGALIIFLVLYPKMKTFITLDKETEQKNIALQDEYSKLSSDLQILTIKKDEILKNIKELELYAQNVGDILFTKNKELAETNLDHAAEKMSQEFQKYQSDLENEYLQMMEDFSKNYSEQMAIYNQQLSELNAAIQQKRMEVAAAVEASKRAEQMAAEKDFYKLNLSNDDINEINKLREILPYLRDSEPLNKVIWKVYYEKPYTDMIGRVVGTGVHTGIYKITNLKNGMCYVGQAANIADRWRQHIKRGIGAEAPTRNKLYPAMLSFGVENFTFEIIEECDRNLLNDREDYWQEFFKAKEFGYSIK